jgi:LmbE family N-acetylglucosaminyl deacetylase
MKTLNFVAHQDDDLLFMFPDILQDIDAGYEVQIVYLTAGDIHKDHENPYPNERIKGLRAAYSQAANVPNEWTYEELEFVGGRKLASNTLNGTNLRLIFTFIKAAAGGSKDPLKKDDPEGDLYKMLKSESYEAKPLDKRPSYNKAKLLEVLRDLICKFNPDLIRIQDRDFPSSATEHIDHISGALFASEASAESGKYKYKVYLYYGYAIKGDNMLKNVHSRLELRKRAVWRQYIEFDKEAKGSDWDATVMNRQHIRSIHEKGSEWKKRPLDFYVPPPS